MHAPMPRPAPIPTPGPQGMRGVDQNGGGQEIAVEDRQGSMRTLLHLLQQGAQLRQPLQLIDIVDANDAYSGKQRAAHLHCWEWFGQGSGAPAI